MKPCGKWSKITSKLRYAVLEAPGRLDLGKRGLGAKPEQRGDPILAGALDRHDPERQRLQERVRGLYLARHVRNLIPDHRLVLELLAKGLALA